MINFDIKIENYQWINLYSFHKNQFSHLHIQVNKAWIVNKQVSVSVLSYNSILWFKPCFDPVLQSYISV